ncbi:MAG: imidazoleglycerol-phosphate dehydratase HisB [Deltaproteobacteria bacterium]|nr:imidazoleglycerol-phosphate dehydratase HisB [Deltaproteobacteria bacterium]
MKREARISRKTEETEVEISLCIDGSGKAEISTPVGFLNHMLETVAKHSNFDIKVQAKGDVEVDFHHTVEDIGIVLGKTFLKALGEKKGIKRFASAIVPMDDALTLCSVDIGGRPYLYYNLNVNGKLGNMDVEVIEEFFRAFSYNALINLYIDGLHGKNAHHIIESAFKAFSLSLKEAVRIEGENIPSTKGVL